MNKSVTSFIHSVIRKFGFDIIRYTKDPLDFSQQNSNIYNTVKAYTMTDAKRVNVLIDAVHYIVTNNIEGAFVECGVWKGGSTMAMALTLKILADESRDLYLYDTFSGMSTPSDDDVSFNGLEAYQKFSRTKISEDSSNWCFSSLNEVKENIFSTEYPREKIHFIEGKVEDTVPTSIPGKIALLRLDTDWYESTKHEMTHLFPLLNQNGILIIDDYDKWKGSRKAIDEYIADNNICILLNPIDGRFGRIAIKT